MADNVDDFLAHYGVPGMKWGRRKARSGGPSVFARAREKRANVRKAENPGSGFTPSPKRKNTSIFNIATALSAVGSAVVSIAASNPKVKAGAAVLSIMLTGASYGGMLMEDIKLDDEKAAYGAKIKD